MIVKMKKATVLMRSVSKEEHLKQLRKAGILHLKEMEGKGDEYLLTLSQLKDIEEAISVIKHFNDHLQVQPVKANLLVGVEKAKHINTIFAQMRELQDQIGQIKQSIDAIQFWGDFSPEDLSLLENKNCFLSLYLIPAKKMKKIPKELNAYKVAASKEKIGIVLISHEKSIEIEKLPTWFTPVEIPKEGISQMKISIENLEAKIQEKRIHLDLLMQDYGALLYLREILQESVEFSKVYSGSTLEEEPSLSAACGYLPETQIEQFKKLCDQQKIGYLLDEVDPDDEDVPVCIHNNRIVKLISPLFNLLGTVPGYREYDISPFFLLFFILFFAMIFGDAGYGALLFVGSAIGMIVSAAKRKKPPLLLSLIAVLSFATVIWGSITGSWFGSRSLVEGTFLNKLVVRNLYAFDPISADIVKYFCFLIALVHLTFAHLWNFLRFLMEKPRIKAFAQIGHLLLLYGLFFFVLYLLNLKTTVPSFALPLIGGGLLMIILFSEQEGRFFKGVGKGLSNLVVIILGAISMFSDIISYIRLFAVGLASLEIAKAFNNMAAGLADSQVAGVGMVGACLILFLGHTLNLILGSLSVIVHGVRLNLLEFSGHLGMEWTGNLYDPFRDRIATKIKD